MLVLSVLCKLLRFKASFAQSGWLVCALVTLLLTGFVGNEKKRASYLHISGQSKQEHMGRKTVVCEQCGRWKPWLHFHQTAPVFVDLPTCGSVSPGSQPSHVLTSGQYFSFFPQSQTRSGPLRPGRGRLWLAVACKPRPPPLVQRRGATAALNGTVRVRARARSLPIKSTEYLFKLEFPLFKYF